jgi:hypothetical protein
VPEVRRAAAIAAIPCLLAACGGPLSAGESQFEKGRYPEAKWTFASLEGQRSTWDDATRAEYALFRGLTHGALGDRGKAAVWLREAKAIEDAHPGSLSRVDAARLRLGLRSLEP